jgi:hypothetical protein
MNPLMRAALRGMEAAIGVAATTVVTLVGAGTLKPGLSLYASAGVLALSAFVRPLVQEVNDRRGSVDLWRERAVQQTINGAFVDLQETTNVPVRSLAVRAYRQFPPTPRGVPRLIGQMAVRVLTDREQDAIRPLLVHCVSGQGIEFGELDARVLMAVPMLDGVGRSVGCLLLEVGDQDAEVLADPKVKEIMEAAARAVWNAANIKATG